MNIFVFEFHGNLILSVRLAVSKHWVTPITARLTGNILTDDVDQYDTYINSVSSLSFGGETGIFWEK